MVIVYSLKEDTRHIEQVQKATLTTKEYGIEQTHGLFGSAEWWTRIGAGELQVHTLKGQISKVYMGSMGDWPMFSIVSDEGNESHWTREVNSAEKDALYRVDSHIEIDYVLQRHRPGAWSSETRVVLEIRIKDLTA